MKVSKQLKQMHKLHTPSGKAFLKTFALYLVSQPRHQFVPATLHSSYSAMAIVEKATPGKTATVFDLASALGELSCTSFADTCTTSKEDFSLRWATSHMTPLKT